MQSSTKFFTFIDHEQRGTSLLDADSTFRNVETPKPENSELPQCVNVWQPPSSGVKLKY